MAYNIPVSPLKSAAPSTSEANSKEQFTAGDGKDYLFAHISDTHLSTLENIRYRDLINKRLLGYLSWRSHRRKEHRADVLAALVRDLGQCRPQHTVITGDLTHLGMQSEFLEAARWLAGLGTPEQFTVIPGNHDTYVRSHWSQTFAHWLPYLASDALATTPAGDLRNGLFPSVRIRDHIAFIGLSSARPSAPFLAVGSLGRQQLQALSRILAETGERRLFRVVLIHHPPLAETLGWRKRLTDGSALRNTLEEQGVELVLHGHAHRATRGWITTAAGSAPVIGVPSASAIGHKPGRRARYNLCRVSRAASGWALEIEARAYAPELDSFIPAGRVLDSAPHQDHAQNQDGNNRQRDHEQGTQVQHETQVGH
jgi:3',5'-cyclic AMP phosphodiesterase CpdA